MEVIIKIKKKIRKLINKVNERVNEYYEILRRVNIKSLILLIVFFISGSYAWMIYNTSVSAGVNAHIASWEFDLTNGDNGFSKDIVFDVELMYPGMSPVNQVINVNNSGDLDGKITYEIKKLEILGNVYEVNGSTITSESLKRMMEQDFPYMLRLSVEGETDEINRLPAGESKKVFLAIEWPYESGKDDLDSYWGEQAASYHTSFPDKPSVHMELTMKIIQIND